MKIKMSATFEGKCTICGRESIVFTIGDEDTKRTASVCKECSEKMGDTQLSEVIEKYGQKDEKSFEDGISIKGKMKAG
jgi:transcription elongation factor Elf1